MTISTTTLLNSFSGNGSVVDFTYTYPINSASELLVIIKTDATGVETTKTLTSDYTVALAGDSGGTVTMGTAPASGETLFLIRNTTKTQGTDLIENDPFSAEGLEDSFDNLQMQIQEVSNAVDRSFKVSKTNSITTSEITTSAADRANKILSFDASGNLEATAFNNLDTLNEMTDVTITSVADNEVLAYDSSSSKWINQTPAEASLVSLTGSETLTNKTLTSPVINSSVSGTAVLDEDDMSSDSATKLATQQSIKAYVDSKKADMQFVLEDGDGTEVQIVKDSEVKFVEGGGIDINWTDTSTGSDADPFDLTFAIDSTVATLTGSQTLTNKTLTSPVLNTGVSGTAIKDEDNMASDSATHLATQQSIKAYVDAVTTSLNAQDLDVSDGSSAIAIDLDSETLGILGGTGLTSAASGNNVTLSVDAAQTGITSVTNASLVLGRDADNDIDFTTDNQITFRVSANDGVVFKASGEIEAASLDISGDADIDGTLEADAITVNGTALNTVIAGVTVTNATNAVNSTHVSVADNESTNEENLIPFIEDASATGNVGLESDGDFAYNPSTGTVSATIFKGNIDAVDGDFDGTLEADSITVGGTNLTAIYSPIAGSSNIVTTGALNSGSITSGFGNIDNGSSTITTTGAISGGTINGIPFYSDSSNNSMYTHDVSGTDSTAENNTAYGFAAMDAITTGDKNVAVGKGSLGALTTGEHNIGIGFNAADGFDTETNNIGIGSNALGGGSLAGGEFNVAVGVNALDALTSADFNTAVGYNAGTSLTTGGNNTIMGYVAGAALTDDTNNVLIGYRAGNALTDSDNVVIGSDAARQGTTLSANVIIGMNAAANGVVTGDNNVVIGKDAGLSFTSANGNVVLGMEAGEAMASADGNTLVGFQAGKALNYDGDSYNVMLGYQAGLSITNAAYNTLIGGFAGDGYDTESHNTAVGYLALSGPVAGGEYNVAIGNYTLDALTSGDENTAMGYQAGSSVTTANQTVLIGRKAGFAVTEASNTVAIGNNAVAGCTTGTGNIGVGAATLESADTETNNLAIGLNALNVVNSGGEYNVAIGNFSLDALTSGDYNIAVGYGSGGAVTTGTGNIFMGYDAAASRTEGNDSVFLGYRAGHGCTTGNDIVFIGKNAGDGHDTEGNNLGIGTNALGGPIAGGEYNVAIGNSSLDAVTSGDSNTAVGYQAGTAINSGSNNVMIGYQAGDDITTGSGVVNIGDNTDNGGNVNHSIVIGQAASGKGANTGFISPNGGAVYQGNNSTTWSQTSDIRIKKNIEDNNIGLEKINKIKVRNFEYKLPEEITEVPTHAAIKKEGVQLGVIAQEIQEVLPDTVVQTTHGVYSVNPDNITWYLVNAVQELSAQVTTLQQEINTLKGE